MTSVNIVQNNVSRLDSAIIKVAWTDLLPLSSRSYDIQHVHSEIPAFRKSITFKFEIVQLWILKEQKQQLKMFMW